MSYRYVVAGAAAGLAVLAARTAPAADAQAGTAFRGVAGLGSYSEAGLPTAWNEKAGTGIRWKTKLSLRGWGSPVVADGKVVVTGADQEKRVVWCFNAADGKPAWKTELPAVEGAAESYVTDTMDEGWNARMYAAATPVTDGKLVFVMFSIGQLAALNLADGKVVWNIGLGDPSGNTYGLSSALRLYKDTLIAVFQGDDSYIAGFEAATGKQRWKSRRSSATWASPTLVHTAGGKDLVVLLADPDATAWDPATGAKVWSIDILGSSPEYCVGPSPVFNGKLVMVNSENAGIYAIDPDTGKKAWGVEELPEAGAFPDGVSMVTHGKYVYQFYKSYISCLDAGTGEVVKEKELDEQSSYASPFVNGDKIYLMTTGDTLVVDADPEKDFAVIDKGSLRDTVEASPAVAGDAIYIRGDEMLYCIGK